MNIVPKSWSRLLKLTASFLFAFLIIFELVGCGQEEIPTPIPTPIPTAVPTAIPTPTISPEKLAEYEEIFDIVWNTVNEAYFDPDFNGVDWEAVHDEYQPRIQTAENEKAFYVIMNEMCFELGVSHIVLVPPDSIDLEEYAQSMKARK